MTNKINKIINGGVVMADIVNRVKILRGRDNKDIVLGKCLDCNDILRFTVKEIENGSYKRRCKCSEKLGLKNASRVSINTVGEVVNMYKSIKELGHDGLLVKCMRCSSIAEVNKTSFRRGALKECACSETAVTSPADIGDMTGYKHVNGYRSDNYVALGIDNFGVRVQCMDCGRIKSVKVKHFTSGRIGKCTCKTISRDEKLKKRQKFIEDRLKEPHINNRKVIDRISDNAVLTQCIYCNRVKKASIMDYVRGAIEQCKCLNELDLKGCINNITIIAPAFKDKDGTQYYKCVCNICGNVMTLNANEIRTHKCL